MLWELSGSANPETGKGSHGTVFSLAFVQDDKELAVGYVDGPMSLWNLMLDKERRHNP